MTSAQVQPTRDMRRRPDLRASVEDFLHFEAELLDSWKLLQWFELFAPDGRYLVPSTDLPNGEPSTDLMLVHDDYALLEQRVKSLLRRSAHAEFPQSRTRRLVTNVTVFEAEPGLFEARANFAVYRFRASRADCYVGSYRHRLIPDGERYLFLERRSVLDHEALTQGKLSIIL
jgi:p-cumate 2,3-dioxygenase subunit beta